eukprot:TRINITY_DN12009_c0_g1_i1.p1 TRINITY_DN12009_c0_g1~~TRINITY_DN12009_c0_g1_i1.p1  ORF type:complete len:188 (+),score=28.62 TRINITY_DN12009_c0_g1_i1:103-666(+)
MAVNPLFLRNLEQGEERDYSQCPLNILFERIEEKFVKPNSDYPASSNCSAAISNYYCSLAFMPCTESGRPQLPCAESCSNTLSSCGCNADRTVFDDETCKYYLNENYLNFPTHLNATVGACFGAPTSGGNSGDDSTDGPTGSSTDSGDSNSDDDDNPNDDTSESAGSTLIPSWILLASLLASYQSVK